MICGHWNHYLRLCLDNDWIMSSLNAQNPFFTGGLYTCWRELSTLTRAVCNTGLLVWSLQFSQFWRFRISWVSMEYHNHSKLPHFTYVAFSILWYMSECVSTVCVGLSKLSPQTARDCVSFFCFDICVIFKLIN